mmetsp:Transcript_9440/g.38614  ORF Transcript_9440/g.38614 Transcript_9440/m.38614 type:complete len:282 (-) Transcript_9440:431-1276(-)
MHGDHPCAMAKALEVSTVVDEEIQQEAVISRECVAEEAVRRPCEAHLCHCLADHHGNLVMTCLRRQQRSSVVATVARLDSAPLLRLAGEPFLQQYLHDFLVAVKCSQGDGDLGAAVRCPYNARHQFDELAHHKHISAQASQLHVRAAVGVDVSYRLHRRPLQQQLRQRSVARRNRELQARRRVEAPHDERLGWQGVHQDPRDGALLVVECAEAQRSAALVVLHVQLEDGQLLRQQAHRLRVAARHRRVHRRLAGAVLQQRRLDVLLADLPALRLHLGQQQA